MTLHGEVLQSESLEASRAARDRVATLQSGTLHGVRGAYCELRSAVARSARADKGACLPPYADVDGSRLRVVRFFRRVFEPNGGRNPVLPGFACFFAMATAESVVNTGLGRYIPGSPWLDFASPSLGFGSSSVAFTRLLAGNYFYERNRLKCRAKGAKAIAGTRPLAARWDRVERGRHRALPVEQLK
jgi:hypothetical protein